MERFSLPFVVALLLSTNGAMPVLAQTAADQASRQISFNDALEKVRTARFSDYQGRIGVAVESERAFEEMRNYILDMYDGVEQVSSFIQDDSYVDCITVESQPSVRHLGIKECPSPDKTGS